MFPSNIGALDEDEIADVIEYMNMDVSDAKQERLFKRFDLDGSGFIEYPEFKRMWLLCCDVKEELLKRGYEVGKHTSVMVLRRRLEQLVDEEEEKE